MARSPSIPIVSIVVVMAAVGLVATDRASAAEPRTAVMQVLSSDATALFVPLGLNKSVVIELPTDIKDVLVSNPKIVNTIVRSRRRVYIIGTDVGATNVYFFDADGQQIGGLVIGVSNDQQITPPLLENSNVLSNSITVYRGM